MKNKRVLITGGSGFVAHWLKKTRPGGVTVVDIDRISYEMGLWETRTCGGWDAIIHLAPVSPAHVLACARKNDARVLFASSGAVYSHQTAYADNKRQWEQEVNKSGVDCVVARLFTFIGEHLKNLYAITKFIEAAKAGKPLEVWGDGSTVRSYLYGTDLGRWLWKLLLEGEGVYDVGSGIPYTILEVAQEVADVIPAKIHVLNDGHPYSCYLPHIENYKRIVDLGCYETVELKQAIEKVANER